MQRSDRGFGKAKSLLKSSVSDCGTVRLLFSSGCCLLSSTYSSWFLVGVLSTVPPVTWPISLSVNACLLSCTIVPTLTNRSNNSRLSLCVMVFILKKACFLSFATSTVELLALCTGKQRRLFISECWVPSCAMLRENMLTLSQNGALIISCLD